MNQVGNKETVGKGPFDVTRRIPLAPGKDAALDEVVRGLAALEPVREARLEGSSRLRVRYDASCLSIGDVLAFLDEAGVPRREGFGWRMKSAWYGFLDGNARSNALSTGGACCNRPPSVHGGDTGKAR